MTGRIGTGGRRAALCFSALVLAGCTADGRIEPDLRGLVAGVLTTASVVPSAARPRPDARGVVTLGRTQVAVARPGDTPTTIAARLGLPVAALARHNAIGATTPLDPGAVLVLPAPVVAGTAGAGAARQHRVAAGETSWSIARRYGVAVADLAAWNGLPPDMAVRPGQRLVVPAAAGPVAARTRAAPVAAPGGAGLGATATAPRPAGAARGGSGGGAGSASVGTAPASGPEAAPPVTAPGEGTPVPPPPSAATALPQGSPPAANAPVAVDLADLGPPPGGTAGGRLLAPVDGPIVRPYAKGENDGIDIAATASAPVRAADDGTVAAITTDTGGLPIVVLRHADGLLTVYAGLTDLTADKGARIARGARLGRVAPAGLIHFEVRRGFESLDPEPFLRPRT